MTREELMDVLCQYEAAIQAVNDDGSLEALMDLEAAREGLMDVLLDAKGKV